MLGEMPQRVVDAALDPLVAPPADEQVLRTVARHGADRERFLVLLRLRDPVLRRQRRISKDDVSFEAAGRLQITLQPLRRRRGNTQVTGPHHLRSTYPPAADQNNDQQ